MSYTTAILDHWSNPAVDKAHEAFYILPEKFNAGGITFIRWINQMVLGDPNS